MEGDGDEPINVFFSVLSSSAVDVTAAPRVCAIVAVVEVLMSLESGRWDGLDLLRWQHVGRMDVCVGSLVSPLCLPPNLPPQAALHAASCRIPKFLVIWLVKWFETRRIRAITIKDFLKTSCMRTRVAVNTSKQTVTLLKGLGNVIAHVFQMVIVNIFDQTVTLLKRVGNGITQVAVNAFEQTVTLLFLFKK